MLPVPQVALLLRRSCLWVASCLAASRLGPVRGTQISEGSESLVHAL